MNITSSSTWWLRGVGLLLLGYMTMGAKGGCLPETDPTPSPQCQVPKDCEGRPHILCLGAWQCENQTCLWQCDSPEPECTTDADCADKPAPIRCPGTWSCVQGTCEYACDNEPPPSCEQDKDCPKGMHCEWTSECPPCGDAEVPCGMPCELKGSCVADPVLPTCVTGGCSGELCVPEGSDIASPCWYLDWFACLQYSRCGNFGANGACGWEATPEFEKCLQGLACSSDQACPEGYACVEGQCVKRDAPLGCYSDMDCPKGTHCSVRDGDCGTDPNCPMCTVCYGHCVPDQEPLLCESDGDCPEGTVCVEEVECPSCVYENPPCRAPCRVYHVCRPMEPGQCRTDEDCKPGERCFWTGLCPPCDCDPATETDCQCACPPIDHGFCGPACDPGTPEVCGNGIDDNCNGLVDENCPAPRPCIQDQDCLEYEFCDLGQPIYSPDGTLACCPPNARCTPDLPPCDGGVCRLREGFCWTDGDCLPGNICEGAVICPPGAMCFVPDRPGRCTPGTYIPCMSDRSCPEGWVCDTSQCLSCCPDLPPEMGCIAACCGQCVPAGGCVDRDGDGFCVPMDCDDSSPRVFPGAPEVCGNGQDDNCDGVVDETCGGCMSDQDCPPDQYCWFPDFSMDGGQTCCPPNAFCIPEIPPCPGLGQCVPRPVEPTTCRSDRDCGEGLRCIITLTWPLECCPPGEICLMIYPPCEGTCELQVGRCWSRRDCQEGQTCVGARICPPGALCLLPDAPGTCQDAPLPIPCDANGSCPKGMACTTDTVCPPCTFEDPPCEMPCQTMNVCKRVCQSDADCPESEFCNALRCGGTRCPGPWFCEPR